MDPLYRQLDRFTPYDEYERCAVLLGGRFVSLAEVENVHHDPANYYTISRTEAELCADKQQRPIVGFLHTHTLSHLWEPSDMDLQAAAGFPDLVHYVYCSPIRRLVRYNESGVQNIKHIRARIRHRGW